MLTRLSDWALSLLAFSVCAFLWRHLSGSLKTSDLVRRALACVTLLLAFSPLLWLQGRDLPQVDVPTASASADALRFLPTVERELDALCAPVIRRYTDAPYSFDADAHITDDGGIDITVVSVSFDETVEDADALTGELIDLLGPAVTVIFPLPTGAAEAGA